jgi:hypothetical protein
MSDRPSRSIAQAITTSNLRQLASLSMAFIPGRWSRPLAPTDAGIAVDLNDDPACQSFANAIDEAGLPDDIVMHGLWKTAARMLANGLRSTHEIASITGHKSHKEIERYTREANQRMRASAAILKLEQNEKRTSSGKRTPAPSGKQRPGA